LIVSTGNQTIAARLPDGCHYALQENSCIGCDY